MRHGSLFSGIGGFDLASEWMGWENVFHCEWNEFGQKVLKYYWPKAISYHDITKTDFSIHRGTIDIITGGFPCQPYSMAGKRKGKEDERHLWPEMLRAIREIQPSWVVGENVLGLVNWNEGLVFEEVQADLEAQGYEVQPYVLPAASVNAPHRRDRVWFVAFKNSYKNGRRSFEWEKESSERKQWNTCTRGNERLRTNNEKVRNATDSNDTRNSTLSSRYNRIWEEKSQERKFSQFEFSGLRIERDATNTECIRLEHGTKSGQIRGEKTNASREGSKSTLSIKTDGNGYKSKWENFPISAPICSGNDGISDRLDSITFPKWRNESIKAGGNAIVPQVVYQIFKAIEQYNNLKK